jgi:two-component system nitrate/nitrite sensor histidine kinase NarX
MPSESSQATPSESSQATPSESPQATIPESAHARSGSLQATGSESVHAPSSTFAHEPPTHAVERWAYEWVDNRLKVMSVLLPVGFIIALEFARFMLGGQGFGDGFHLFFVAITVVCIIAFGLVMFRFIDRAQRQVVRQNRELVATNAVTNAVQGEVGVDRIIDVVLESLLTTSGASEASVTIFNSEDRSPTGNAVTRRRLRVSESGVFVPADPEDAANVIDIPLSTGTLTVGRMRLRLPVSEDDGLASGTLQNIGHQLASAIQRAQLVADLNRRKHEGHAFYDVLLQISNQNAPPDILSAVVLHARDMMGSDEAVLSLNEGASRSVQFAGTLEGGTAAFNDGTDCITSETGPRHIAHGDTVPCPVRSSPEWKAIMTVPIRGPVGLLGELWIGRRPGVQFTERDRAFLVTLSGLAAIAITAAQMRENGRQRAVLAERGRIAREMHDSLAQVLGVTHLRLRALDAREEVRDSREIAVELAELADICQEAYRDVRESILGLRGSNRAERGLLDNLRAYLAKYSQQCEITTSLDCDIDHDLTLSPRCEVQVIRVIQEALTNVRKHSGAKSAVVHITETDSSTTFVVEDDGHGFDPGDSPHDRDGFGLFTMRERVALLNGSLRIDSAPGRGTRVIADIPERSHPRPVHNEVKNAAARTDTNPAG